MFLPVDLTSFNSFLSSLGAVLDSKKKSIIISFLAFPLPVANFLITVGGMITVSTLISKRNFLSIAVFSAIENTLPLLPKL